MSADDELRASLREPHDEPRARKNWEAIERRRHRTPALPMGRGPLLGGLAVGAVVIAFVALAAVRDPAPGPLVLEDGRVASGAIVRDRVALDDGSQVSLEPGARLEILENAGDRIRFWLRGGVARFDVVSGGPRRWVIETGLVTVEVLGTAFSVEHGEHEVRVSVERGSVLVRGPTAPDGMRRLGAGESLAVPTGEPTVVARVDADEVAAVAQREVPLARTAVAPLVEPELREPTGRAEHRVVDDREAAIRAESAEAAGPSGARAAGEVTARAETIAAREGEGAEVVEVAPAPAARLRDADALRAQGRIEEAVTLLEAIANDPSAGDERALAAFTRARIELDRRHRPRDAAAAFAHAIELGLREPLLEDARARRVEALSRSADPVATRAAAVDYLVRHPDGRWRREVERWSASL